MTHPPDSGSPRERARPPHWNDHDADDADADSEEGRERAVGSVRAGPLVAEWSLTRTDDATLVTVHVTNTHATSRTLRLENRLDGSVLPPRRRGVAETGWDEDGLTRRVPGEGRVSVGYACRAPPKTPPVEIRDGPGDATDDDAPLDRALRSLGDHAPPRSVVSPDGSSDPDPAPSRDPDPETSREPASTPPVEPATEGGDHPTESASEEDDHPTESANEEDDHPTESASEGGNHADAGTALDTSEGEAAAVSGPSHSSAEVVPVTVGSWFRAVEARLATADRLAGDVEEATPVVASLGGRVGVEVLAETLEADAAALARVASRAGELADRVDKAEVPDLEGSR